MLTARPRLRGGQREGQLTGRGTKDTEGERGERGKMETNIEKHIEYRVQMHRGHMGQDPIQTGQETDIYLSIYICSKG